MPFRLLAKDNGMIMNQINVPEDINIYIYVLFGNIDEDESYENSSSSVLFLSLFVVSLIL
jgi:hypothetical protein